MFQELKRDTYIHGLIQPRQGRGRTEPEINLVSLFRRSLSRQIQKGLIDAGIPVLQTELTERDAYRAVFAFQQTLDQLNPSEVPNLDKAKRNIEDLASEILARLTIQQGRGFDTDADDDETDDEIASVAGVAG